MAERSPEKSYGDGFLENFNVAVRAERGAGYRRVSALTLRPSQDIGAVAAECYARQGPRSMGLLPALFTNLAQRGAPEREADLLSYRLFDRCFTRQLVDLGREDARAQSDEILAMLGQ